MYDTLGLFEHLTILYAEDEESLRHSVAQTLELFFKRVIQASNGEEAEELFYEHSGDQKDIHTNVNDIAKVSSPYLEFPELASVFGGKIATRQDGNKRLKTEQAYYKVIIDLNESDVRLRNRSVGTLLVEGESSSLITKVYKKALSVVIRESGF